MTDQEVLTAIRRRLAGIETELLVDQACTAVQWVYAMTEISKEMAAAFAAPASAPPVNRDVPHLEGTGALGEILTVTMGNWDNEPTDYGFAWKRDESQDVGSNSMNYRVDTADRGHSITCVVTAINSKGSVAAPPSNAVAVAAAPAGATAAAPASAPARTGAAAQPTTR